MICPPYGVCLPCRVEEVHDGDTVYVRVHDPKTGSSGLTVWHVRLIECWAPELNKPLERDRAIKARDFLRELLRDEEEISVFIPLQPGILNITNMGRIVGRLFVGSEEVAAVMVRHGHATKEKRKDRKV